MMQTLDQLTLDKSALAFLSFIGVTRTMAGYIFQDFTLFYEHCFIMSHDVYTIYK